MVSRVEGPGSELQIPLMQGRSVPPKRGRRKEVRADRSALCDSMKLPCVFSAFPPFCCSAS